MPQLADDIIFLLLRNQLQQQSELTAESSFIGDLSGFGFDSVIDHIGGNSSDSNLGNAFIDGFPSAYAALSPTDSTIVHTNPDHTACVLNRLSSNTNTIDLASLFDQFHQLAAPIALPPLPVSLPTSGSTALEILDLWFESPPAFTMSSPPDLILQSPSTLISSPSFATFDSVIVDSNNYPPALRKYAEISCQTELTYSDVDAQIIPRSPTIETDVETESDSEPHRHKQTVHKTPMQTYKKILKTRKDCKDGQYHCPSCDRAFTRRFNLKTHYGAQHVNLRKFACRSCERSFSRRYDLQRHEKLVHGLSGGESGGDYNGGGKTEKEKN
ncbi:hypothetical protein BJ742DRAFT_769463 [Cladochytrium replicatum]|nr:hypothetical protein BJ742DRAFT_769463 [Cladochytrium replicatum]